MLTVDVTPDVTEYEEVVVQQAIELADRLGVKVRFTLSIVELTASPGDDVDSILAFYDGALHTSEVC